MRRAFDLLEHLRDVVQIEPGPAASEVAGFNLEGLAAPEAWARSPDRGEGSR